SSVHSLRMNDSDNVAFGAQLQLADDLAVPALLKSYAGPYRVVARAASDGVEGPQLGERVVFTNSQFDATLNRQGDVAFAASVAGPGITSDNDAGIWRASGRERPELLVRAGDELPGV